MHAPVVYSRINFQYPFSLEGIAAMQPAGFYSVETCNQYYWTFPIAWRKTTRTTIFLHTKWGLEGRLQDYVVDPRDLFSAMEKDRMLAAA